MVLNVGIIGLGKMGLMHSAILSSMEGVSVQAISENNKNITKYIESVKSDWNVYLDYNKLINQEALDVVFITTPIFSHESIISQCIDNNIPFFVEKPAVANVGQINAISEKLESNYVKNSVGYMMRYSSTFNKAKDLIDKKIIGTIRNFEATMYVSQLFRPGKGWRYDPKNSGGGVIIHQTCHVIDLLLWYLGTPSKVSATTKSWYSKNVEDYAHIMLDYGKQCSGWIDSSWSRYNNRMLSTNIYFEGSKGTLSIDDDYIRLYLNESVENFSKGWNEISKIEIEQGVHLDLGVPSYSLQDKDFIESLKGDRMSFGHKIEDSVILHKLIDALYISADNDSRAIVVK
jgi:predicted dehydrogenase